MPPRKSRTSAAAPANNAGSDTEMADVPVNSELPQAISGTEASSSQQQETLDAASAQNGEQEFMIGDEDPDVLKVRILPGDSDSAASYEFLNEDHTLGNALRCVIMKNPNVEFCGYSIPHPADPKMNLRIQTYDDSTQTANEILEKGLDDLMDLCGVVLEKFEGAIAEHDKKP